MARKQEPLKSFSMKFASFKSSGGRNIEIPDKLLCRKAIAAIAGDALRLILTKFSNCVARPDC